MARLTLAVTVLIASLTAVALAQPPKPVGGGGSGGACGVERWSVKTLQDPAGRALNLSRGTKTTVPKLRALPVRRGPGGSRGRGVESTVYEVRARLVEAKIEEDSDIHLVIRSLTSSGTMIVELPLAPSCTPGATNGAKTRMRNARSAFVAACGVPSASSFTKLTGKATIRGVGFFDFIHGQTGVAPSGIELHPVLRFINATC